MGNAYNNASLLVTPNGYKASKIYSAKPTDGSGDLAFSRASNATRVNSQGLIEKVRTNLYPNGSALLSTGWTSVGATLTAGQIDPNGGTTALRVEFAATPAYVYQGFTGSAAIYARSVFIKGATAQSVRLIEANTGFDTTINLTTSYQRFALVAAGVPPNFSIGFDNANDNLAKDFTIAFVQIEEGDIATDYIPTTTAAVSVGITANIPRLDYTGGGCPSWLLEPQRTNLAQFSEQFDNAAWTKSNVTISSNTNATLDPSGYNGADKLVEDSSTGDHVTYATQTGTSSTFSFFAKAAERSWVAVLSNNGNMSYFNIGNGTLGTIAATSTATITNYGNGWYRCTLFNSHGTFGANIYLATNNNVSSYAGDGTSGAFIWGAQLEASATYATSYIPTLGSSVTRLADAASKTGISSLIGQTEGTLFVDLNYEAITGLSMFLSIRPDSTNKIEVYRDGQTIYGDILGNSVSVLLSKASSPAGRYKIALAYKSGQTALYVNGTSVGTSSTAFSFASSMADLFVNLRSDTTFIEQAFYNQTLLFKARLSNAELAELTTL